MTPVQHFKRALDDSPDNASLRFKYNDALQKMNDAVRSTEAARQLQAISQVEPQNSPTTRTPQAGFDYGISNNNPLKGPDVPTPPSSPVNDPVVPVAIRAQHPEIAPMEEQRTALRERSQKLDDTIKTLDPAKDSVKIADLKNEKSNLENKVHYLNFSIGQIVARQPDKPAPIKG